MNHALLNKLQGLRAYPSVTILANTTPKSALNEAERKTLEASISATNRRLTGDVPLFVRRRVVERLEQLLEESSADLCAHAVALCVSPEFSAVVRLGRAVEERVIIDDTFATRDLVADLNRTAQFRVVTISDRKTRLLIGDVVDELIEAVLRHGGKAVIVNDGELASHQRIAAVLRF